ncbi:hypothetical protein LOZ36_002286 [Ophidiomyces ophidiicola]|nr:hypothetical protein LOZ36_002286 [Ophidiomyces ophidiicola]
MQTAIPSDGYIDIDRDQGIPPPGRLPARRPPPVPAAFTPSRNGPREMVPEPLPSWPLPENIERREMNRFPVNPSPPNRPTPQRPPRPSGAFNVPPTMDSSRMPEYSPEYSYRQPVPAALEYQYEEPPRSYMQDFASPSTLGRSSASLTDPFSSPELSPDTRSYLQMNQYLGPPSARRGASSFYATHPNISPIQEEHSDGSFRKPMSYASSKVIPSSWGTAPLGEFPDSSRESFANGTDEDIGLVRQASLGKRAKPSLLTINKSQTSQNAEQESRRMKAENGGGKQMNAIGASPGIQGVRGIAPNTTDTSTPFGNQQPLPFSPQIQTRFSSESSSSDASFDDLEKPPILATRYPFPGSEEDLRQLDPNSDKNSAAHSSLSKSDLKRPPPLNIDAVRDAEARGSLTSLPDLIRRATKLASNLDRGKTASKFGVLDMISGNADTNNTRKRNSGSISDILASFPPPGPIATSVAGSRASRMFENRARANPNPPPANPEESRPADRCCGMSRCAFILIIIILFVLISSAVIIPVVLIALPRQQDSGRPANSTLSGECQKSFPCLNGGVSIGKEGSCACVCVNGFRGPRCAVVGDSSCATIDISREYRNATVGNAMPRLFDQSQANFTIPLNASKLLGLFNKEDLSCTSGNALITFNGANRRRDLGDSDSSLQGMIRNNGKRAHRRHGLAPVSKVTRDEATQVQPQANQASPVPIPPKTLDFARISVLFVFEQTEELRNATAAHDRIQTFLRVQSGDLRNAENNPMDLRYDKQSFTLNFRDFTIRLRNGTVVGGNQAPKL